MQRENAERIDKAAGSILPENEEHMFNNSVDNLNAEDSNRRCRRNILIDETLSNTPPGPNERHLGNSGNVTGHDIRRLENLIMQLTDQMQTLRQDSFIKQRNIARLEKQQDGNQQGGAIPRTNHARDRLHHRLSEEDMAIRRELVESHRRRDPGTNYPRRSIRLIRETSRTNAMKFDW